MKRTITAAMTLLAASAFAQSPEALEKQRASVRRQVKTVTATSEFFTTPWISEPTVAMVRADCDPIAEDVLDRLITESAQRESVDPKLVRAVIRKESAGRPCAVSTKGAEGLMQLMPATQIDLGVENSFDPEQNIAGGTRYLKQMLERFKGNVALALAGYNAGPQRVVNGQIPDIPETINYVSDVLGALQTPTEAEQTP
jgi:soluble lytic murein transglycosylase-like protein